MWMRNLLFVSLSLVGLLALGAGLSPQYKPIEVKKLDASTTSGSQAEATSVVDRIDASFRQDWQARGLRPAPRADELTIARRLSLALAGTIPSLEDIRRLEATPMQVALAWLLQRSPIVLPIPGTSRVDHLEENIAAASVKLDAATMKDLDASR